VSGFDEHMSILEALTRHPGARRVFEAHGMSCSLCLGASTETIAAGAVMHQVDPARVVAELNALQHLEAGSL
jgi:hybrid cluster-associated redox disulfide protein